MLPGALTSIYQQYKHDTDSVASWLLTTARETGYKGDLSGDLAGSSNRLKGKARKEVKKRPDTKNPATRGKKYVLPMKLFVPLAEHIQSAQGNGVAVPVWFATALNRAIGVREGFGSKISEHGDDIPEEVEAGHSYFVNVLARVRAILAPIMPKLPDKSKHKQLVTKGETKNEDEPKNGNKFDGLEVHEPSEEFLNAPDVELVNPSERPEPIVEAEQGDSMDDLLFAFYALTQEARVLRDRIRGMWTAYLNGHLGLTSVAVATNTAIALVKQMETDLSPLLKKQSKTIDQLLIAHYIGICGGAGHNPSDKEDQKDDMNFKCYEIGDITMYNVFTLLRAFRDVLTPKAYPAYKPGHYGTYDPVSNRESKSEKDKWTEDKIVLMEALPDLVILGKQVLAHHPVKDEFTEEVSKLYQTKEVTFALIFAAQSFLDVQRVLRNKSARGFVEMTVFGKFIARTVEENLRFQKSVPPLDNWPERNNQVLRNLIVDSQIWPSDPVNDFRTKTRTPTSEPNILLKRHPVFCGLWMHHQRLAFHEAGVVFVGAWGSVMYTGHLYVSILQEKLLRVEPKSPDKRPKQKHWQDMDAALACQEDNFFVSKGEYPKTKEEYFKNFCLCMGVSTQNWAKNQRAKVKKVKQSAKGPRGLKEQGKVSQKFKFEAGCGLTPEAVEAIIASSEFSQKQEEEGKAIFEKGNMEGRQSLIEPGTAAEAPDVPRNDKGKDGKKQVHLSLGALLLQLALTLHIETVELSFDYFAMHRTCWGLLRTIRAELEPSIAKLIGETPLENETQMVWLIGYLYLMMAHGTTTQKEGAEKLLGEVAGILRRDIIEAGKGAEVVASLRSHLGLVLQLGEEEEDDED